MRSRRLLAVAVFDVPLQAVLTSNHVTDVNLLGLAAFHGGKLATFDRSIPATAVENGASSLELIES